MFCQKCGAEVEGEFCSNCGTAANNATSQNQAQPTIIINNTNTNTNTVAGMAGRAKNKWVAFVLCLILGVFGAHKFYEGKIGMGILYIFTGGLFAIGWIVDLIALLCKPNPYYV